MRLESEPLHHRGAALQPQLIPTPPPSPPRHPPTSSSTSRTGAPRRMRAAGAPDSVHSDPHEPCAGTAATARPRPLPPRTRTLDIRLAQAARAGLTATTAVFVRVCAGGDIS